MGDKFRECDKFGAGVLLNYEGRTNNGTLGGGLVTSLLNALALAYLCMRFIAVASYDDLTISSYTIMKTVAR